MKDEMLHVKFDNKTRPQSDFDLIQLSNLAQRTDLDHSIYQLHLVEFYMLVIILDGSGKHTIDFTDYDCERGTILSIRKDQIHKFVESLGMEGMLLLFTDDFLVSYLEELEAKKVLQLFNELLGVAKIQLCEEVLLDIINSLTRIHTEYMEVNDAFSFGIIRSELHILITKLYRIKAQSNQMVKDKKYLRDFIRLQYLVEKHITQYSKVNDYAKIMAVSTKTLYTITKSIINRSAKEFLDEIYIKHIKRLLINTEKPIKEIAYSCGFEETTNFYKYFKRLTETTPEVFREKNT
jgi:AraC-like DNA-binding protein